MTHDTSRVSILNPARPQRGTVAGAALAAGAAALFTGALTSPALAVPNLLANGGFESGSVSGRPDGKGLVPAPWRGWTNGAGSGLSTHGPYDTWSAVAHVGLDPATDIKLFPFPIAAPEGVRFAGGPRSGVLTQRLSAPLVPGTLYDISALLHATHPGLGFGGFDFALTDRSSHATPQTSLIATTSPVFYYQGWVLWSASFIAPAGAATMRDFDISGSMGLGSEYMCLDDVRLTASPTPAPGAAPLLALAGCVAARRRRPRERQTPGAAIGCSST